MSQIQSTHPITAPIVIHDYVSNQHQPSNSMLYILLPNSITAPIYIIQVDNEQSLLQQLQSHQHGQSMINTASSSSSWPPLNAASFNDKSANSKINNILKYREFDPDVNKIKLMNVKKRDPSFMRISIEDINKHECPPKHIKNDDENNHKNRSGSRLSPQLHHLCQFCNKTVS